MILKDMLQSSKGVYTSFGQYPTLNVIDVQCTLRCKVPILCELRI